MLRPDLSLAGTMNGFIQHISKFRFFTFIASLAFAIGTFFIVSDYYEPFKLVRDWYSSRSTVYTFYCGPPDGFYENIGETVAKKSQSKSSININAKNKTAGGPDNAIQVLSSGNSFGLIQGSSLNDNDKIREELQYITPLYMERLHIISRRQQLNKNSDPNELSNLLNSEISLLNRNPEENILGKRVTIGPAGSGSRFIGSLLVEMLDFTPVKINTVTGIDEGIKLLEDGVTDVFITMVGAPFGSINKLLKNPDYMLVGISPGVKEKLNKAYGTNYRLTDFNGKYYGYEDVNTIGSYAYLVASSNIPDHIIQNTVELIDESKAEIKANLNMNDWRKDQIFQLEEIEFVDKMKQKSDNSFMDIFKSIFLIFSVFVGSFLLSVVIIVWISSSWKLAKFFRQITKVYLDFYPHDRILDKDSSSYVTFKHRRSVRESIRELALGLTKVYEITRSVREDYDTGGISESHYKYLIESLRETMEKFKKSIAEYMLYEIKFTDEPEMNDELITNYYSRSYITLIDYWALTEELMRKSRKV